MSIINYQTKEITCKIVYYGPGMSGKTTNLQYLANHIPDSMVSSTNKLIALAINLDQEETKYSGRTRFFDFISLEESVGSFKVKFQTYSVPGQLAFAASRRQMLRGVDGVVFVADAQRDRLDENIASYQELQQALTDLELKIPYVLQVNKIDLPQNNSKLILRNALDKNLPLKFVHEASATKGLGVEETFRNICELILQDVGVKKQSIAQRRKGLKD